ncbi:helix-turn-helix domain-containing protein [Haloarcula litorea]|uniref:helix-turn-helix domain-containing protein n=1 Tax=Haloarcula litorea TaxID=3032579 RepID=UPI0023E8DA87|nr:helix-turn-helix domain-containing protein [Halomicroarcula sp. GDY20]
MITEFHVQSPFLAGVGSVADEVTVRQLDSVDGRCRAGVWVDGADRASIEAALDGDDDVVRASHVGTEGTGEWYLTYTDEATLAALAGTLLRTDCLFARAEVADDWAITARFPDRSTVLAFRDELVEDGVEVSFERMTTEERALEGFGVTDPQREVLLLALEEGYFTVPRDAALSDLAAHLGISSQAASERLRRGTGSLVENTLAAGGDRVRPRRQ